MQTPIVYGDLLYVGRDNGVVTCFDARTGAQKYQTRIIRTFLFSWIAWNCCFSAMTLRGPSRASSK